MFSRSSTYLIQSSPAPEDDGTDRCEMREMREMRARYTLGVPADTGLYLCKRIRRGM